MEKSVLGMACLMIGLLAAAACGPAAPIPTTTPLSSPTAPFQADPCNPAKVGETVKPLNDLVRQFDDYAALASNVRQSALLQVIPPMQAVRRAAEDQAAPACLEELKQSALLYMDATLQTLVSFQASASANAIATGIIQARQYHNQYTLELARLLGVTPSAPAQATRPAPTPAATP